MKQNFYDKSIEETLQGLSTNNDIGLTDVEAKKRLEEYGENKLEGKKERSPILMFIDQFKDFLVLILIAAAVISFFLGDKIEGAAILAIVIINSIIGFTQENKANNALKALKEMTSPQSKVIRDGELIKVPSNELVPGDLIHLEAGDYVPADVRLIETMNLKIDEAALTGESVPSEKDAKNTLDSDVGIGDKTNSGFMGTVVTYGRGNAIVANTGMETEMGHIATMLSETEEEATPLQKRLDKFGKTLGIACLIICAGVFVLGLFMGMDIQEVFMTSVALAVAAIPEGLTIVVTVVLAMGMQKMVGKHAIIKKLHAVETLGSTTVICSDKTGTLTQNKMTVTRIYDTEKTYNVTGTGYDSEGAVVSQDGTEPTGGLLKLLEGAVLCNDALYKKDKGQIIGDPTEGALVVAGEKVGIARDVINVKCQRVNEIPFDSGRKLMSTFHEKEDGGMLMYTKGAPDELLNKSKFIYLNGKIEPLTEKHIKDIQDKNEEFAESALRVLGVAFKEKFGENEKPEEQEHDLIFLGLLGMIDPPREEVKAAVEVCKKAGIDVKMITGDHKITAMAIGSELGIIDKNNYVAVDGKEINDLSDEELREKVKTINIFARVSPEHKVRLVTAIKENGNVVAMTGDGVNDAPSLKRADIGIAMGITGTDVSKEAADMILTDDNFASIVSAVEEGRTIYNNIRKVIGYLISCNIGEILLMVFAMITSIILDKGFGINIPLPLTAVQLLAINLVTDAFPAFALGMEEKEDGIMDMHPRDPSEDLIDAKMRTAITIQSIALALGTLASFLVAFFMHGQDGAVAITCCFVTLVCGELLRAYSARSEKVSIFKMDVFSNSFLNKSVLFSLAFLAFTVYVPFVNDIFNTVPLGIVEVIVSVLFAFVPIIGGEIAKNTLNKKYS